MESIFIDTSAWYAFLNENDSDHEAVRKVFEETTADLVTSNFVIVEILNLLVARRQKRFALEFGKKVWHQSDPLIHTVSPNDEDEAWKMFQKYRDKDYSFTDCTSFVVMKRLKIQTALTLDSDFSQVGFLIVPEVD